MKNLAYLLIIVLLISSCKNEDDDNGYTATPATLEVPALFAQLLPTPNIPQDNPLTEEGVALGRKLFFDPILSADNTLACAACHRPQQGFSDQRQFSIGIDGIAGTRNSMPLQNLAFNSSNTFNWDGSANSLEAQGLEPVTNPIEMHNTWANAASEIEAREDYRLLFEQAFGSSSVDSTLVTKAMSQFIRTLISGDSKFDRYLQEEVDTYSERIKRF